jgi:hypothetical protein
MQRIPFVQQLINDRGSKVYFYFGRPIAGEGFDPYEKNYTYSNLNPVVIKAYIQDVSPEALVWKQYGMNEVGAKEILCDAKYTEWFKTASRIVIDGADYHAFKESVGNRILIQQRPYNIIRVILQKV